MRFRTVTKHLWDAPIMGGKVDLSALPTRLGMTDPTGHLEYDYLCGAYVVYEAGVDRPIYIGYSVDTTRRIVRWRYRADWWPMEGRVEVHIPEVNSVGAAEDLERTMILELNPIRNIVRVPVRAHVRDRENRRI